MIDKFGRPVKVGDKIITWLQTGYGSGTTLQIVTIDKITERQVHFGYNRKLSNKHLWMSDEYFCKHKRTSDQFILHAGE